MNEAKLPAKKTECESGQLFPKKHLLFSVHDFHKIEERSSRARLIQQVGGPDDTTRDTYNKLGSPEFISIPDIAETEKSYATYPSRVGLRWNPCIEVSSGEEFPIEPRPQVKSKPSCNCADCVSVHCPFKNKSGFKDNIMRFSDKNTMTLKLNHASCDARTPLGSPRMSDMSIASRSYTKFPVDVCSMCPKPIFKKSCLRSDSYDLKQYYDEAVRDTDVHEDPPPVQTTYSRHCVPRISNITYESGKINIYNEGISDKILGQFPVAPHACPQKTKHDSRPTCKKKSPDCCCRAPNKSSKYHQKCKTEYNRPVYYDTNPGERHFVVMPDIVGRCTPAYKPRTTPSIQLPRKVLSSQRDIDEFIHEDPDTTCMRRNMS